MGSPLNAEKDILYFQFMKRIATGEGGLNKLSLVYLVLPPAAKSSNFEIKIHHLLRFKQQFSVKYSTCLFKNTLALAKVWKERNRDQGVKVMRGMERTLKASVTM